MAEGEDAGRAGLSGAGGQLGGVLRAGGVLGGGAVPPPVGHHRVVRVHHGGAPRGRRVGVGAPVVHNAVVGEREDTRVIGVGHARVWDPVLHKQGDPVAGHWLPLELERRG